MVDGTIQLGDQYYVEVDQVDHSGTVIGLELQGPVDDPTHVRVKLNSGVEFTVAWEQYDR